MIKNCAYLLKSGPRWPEDPKWLMKPNDNNNIVSSSNLILSSFLWAEDNLRKKEMFLEISKEWGR